MKALAGAFLCLILAIDVIADPASAYAVIVSESGRAAAGSWPITDAELERARDVYVWTAEQPIRRYSRDEFLRIRTRVLSELARDKAPVLRVRIASSRKTKLADVTIRYAPPDVWAQIPEHLLPLADVSEDGWAVLPYRGETLRLRAIRAAEGTSWRDVRPAARPVLLDLLSARDVQVAVTSEDGIAEVGATLMMRRDGLPRSEVIAQYSADSKGVLRIPSVPNDDLLSLLIFSQGHAPAHLSGRADVLPRTVNLARAGALRGRFVDEKGNAVAGVRITAESWLQEDLPALSRAEATSGADGAWRIPDLALRDVTIVARARGFAVYRDKAMPKLPELDLGVLTLESAARLLLQVVDDSGEPVSGARVLAGGVRVGRTDEKGFVRFDEASSTEPAELTIQHDAFETARLTVQPPFRKIEQVSLQRPFTLRGRVVDDDDRVVGDAHVLVEVGNAYRTEPIARDGGFAIRAARGKDIRLTFESPASAPHTIIEAPGESGEVRDLGTIRVSIGNVVYGSVVGPNGEPVRDARVWVLRRAANGVLGSWLAGRWNEARTGADGAFELRGLAGETVALRIDARGLARVTRTISIEGTRTDAGLIVLSRGSDVIVRAPSTSSRGIARVDLAGSWLEVDMLTAPISEGQATIRSVPAGQHTVTVVDGPAVICEKQFAVPGHDVRLEVTCAPPVRVAGQVMIGNAVASGGTLTWSRIDRVETEALISRTITELGTRRSEVFGGGAGTTLSNVDVNGRFTIEQLLPGSWTAAFWSSDGGAFPAQRVEIPEVAAANLTLRYDGSSVTGVVVDQTGAPVAGAHVRAGAAQLAISDRNGAFRFLGITPGPIVLEARKGSVTSSPKRIEIEPGSAVANVELVLDPDATQAVRVRVLTASGGPAEEAFVFVASDLGNRILTTDASGEAEAKFSGGRPSSLRLASYWRGAWAFLTVATPGTTQVLQHSEATGALVLRSARVNATPRVIEASGLDLTWMRSRLGSPTAVSPDAPLTIRGLPAGRYIVIVEGDSFVADVRRGETAELTFR